MGHHFLSRGRTYSFTRRKSGQVWVKSDVDGTSNYGVASMEAEVLSLGTLKTTYGNARTFTAANTTAKGYSTVNPSAQDGSGATPRRTISSPGLLAPPHYL